MNTPIHARSIMQLRRILTLYNIYMVRQVEMFSYIFSSSLIGQSISISLYPLYTAYNSFGNFFRWLICRQQFCWPFSLLENLDGGRLIQVAVKLTIRISLSICWSICWPVLKIPPQLTIPYRYACKFFPLHRILTHEPGSVKKIPKKNL